MLLAAILASIMALPGASSAPAADSPGQGQEDGSKAGPQAQASGPESPADAARRAAATVAPQRKIGKIRGVRFLSQVAFRSAPDLVQTLDVSMAFPARTKMVLRSSSGTVQRFQLGDVYFSCADHLDATERAPASEVVRGAPERELGLDLALRRALFLWPDEFSFEGAGSTMTARVGDFAVLMATVDEVTGRPTKLVAFRANGRAAAEFRNVVWKEQGGRFWPHTFEFAANGKSLWNEAVDEVQTRWRFADSWFFPADVVTALLGEEISDRVRMHPSARAWVRRMPLIDEPPESAPELDLASAVERALAVWSQESAEPVAYGRPSEGPPARYGDFVSIVLDEAGTPVAVELEVPSEPIADRVLPRWSGWTLREVRVDWSYACTDLEADVRAGFEAVTKVAARASAAPGSEDAKEASGRAPEPGTSESSVPARKALTNARLRFRAVRGDAGPRAADIVIMRPARFLIPPEEEPGDKAPPDRPLERTDE